MPRSFPALIKNYQPATFNERGVAVPFTTPPLSGARVRRADRGGIEIIVPNPSGTRGVYVTSWAGLADLCRPSVHDHKLHKSLAALPCIDPAGVRAATRDVALSGYAGRDAAAACAAEAKADEHDMLVTNFELLRALVRQADREAQEKPGALALSDEFKQRAKRVLDIVASRLGADPDRIAVALEELAALFRAIGIGQSAGTARLPRVLGHLLEFVQEMETWAGAHSDDTRQVAQLVGAAGSVTAACATRTLGVARELTEDIEQLLATWWREPGKVMEIVTRPDWLLDGWERMCQLWQQADPPQQRAILAELFAMVPAVPKQVTEWVGSLDIETTLRSFRMVQLNHDWRSGTLLSDLVARNERLGAMARHEGPVMAGGQRADAWAV